MNKQTYITTGNTSSTYLYESEYTGTITGLKRHIARRRRDELPSNSSARMVAWVKGDESKTNVLK